MSFSRLALLAALVLTGCEGREADSNAEPTNPCPGDGGCSPEPRVSPCSTFDCGQHGACVDGVDKAICICDAGFQGGVEAPCAPIPSICAGQDCGTGGRCVDADGEPLCICPDAGFCVDGGAPEGYVRIEAGEFWMGSQVGELGRDVDETYRRVRISRPFLMKATEVTQAEWRALMLNNPSSFDACGDDCPVETVNWYEAAAYCNARSRAEGLEVCYMLADCVRAPGDGMECSQVEPVGADCGGYRLPTEAEWEYAARAGTDTAFHSGDISQTGCGADPNLEAVGWYCGNSDDTTHPVASKLPNAWGLYDVHGNVSEWTEDWLAFDYEGFEPVPPEFAERVFRGGSWKSNPMGARAARRPSSRPGDRFDFLGFRVARSVP